MTRLTWDDPTKRYYAHGLDRGVLYITGRSPVVWNGLTAVNETGNGSSTVLYRDGVIYLADTDPGDFSAKVSAMFYPDEFSECLGIPSIADGLYADNQKPKRFSMAYRTLIGNGGNNDRFGYQIHLVYNAIVSINDRARTSDSDKTDSMPFDFDLAATPVKAAGFRPTAHYIVDTRFLSSDTVTSLENMLYGSVGADGAMPTIQTLTDLLSFGNNITLHDTGDGFMSITGSNANVQDNGDGSATINNINATTDSDGYITITSNPTTIIS